MAHAMPDAHHVAGAGKATRRAAQQLHTGKEAPAPKRTSSATTATSFPSGTTGSLSTPSDTNWAMTSACRWPSRARPTLWPFATATVSRDT
eukprot:4671084-Pleurochrysis_carterae.AAC.1